MGLSLWGTEFPITGSKDLEIDGLQNNLAYPVHFTDEKTEA